MATYKELQAEISALQAQAEEARLAERSEALDRIRALIVEYQLLPADLGFGPPSSSTTRPSAPAAPKYRDEATGATWTGRGRTPRWLEGKDKSAYSID